MAKTKIESNHVTINKPQQFVFEFMEDFNNIKQLLPQDDISDWRSDENQCSFKVKNAAIIPLVKKNTNPSSEIFIISGEKAPFPFELVVHFKAIDDQTTEAYLNFEGDINAFLKMMVVKPLTNLFNYMANKLKEVSETN
jgi:carbon monoxide dehydrogenase subunit G